MNTIKEISKKATVRLVFLFAVVMITSCNNDDPVTDPTPPLPLTFDPNVALELKTVASFDAFTVQLPESITLDNSGNIYISMSPLREVWKLNPDGTFKEVVASFPLEPGLLGINGLKFDSQGNLYVAIFSSLPDMIGVWKIKSNSEKERIPGSANIPLPNDIAFSSDGTLYITDALMGSVWRQNRGGEAELWIQNEAFEGTGAFGLGFPLGANGIVVIDGKKSPPWDNSQQNIIGGVIVANSEKGQLVYVPILPNKSAGEPIIMISNMETLFGLDGITMDEEGAVYGAVNFGNKIVRLSSDGQNLSDLASGLPLDFPTSLAFGSGSDVHKLFITNFGAIHFLSNPPMPEDASPAVISVVLGYK
ncbi:MAG: SMP-30/gluconolactonase/LRE family protein [Aequorivita sp.]